VPTVADPEAAPFFREFFLNGRRQAVAVLWDRALSRGEVKTSASVDTAIDLLFGPLIFRLLSGHATLTPPEADAIADAALTGLLA
jgi:hypothetical protein